jgi:hypothetical protein
VSRAATFLLPRTIAATDSPTTRTASPKADQVAHFFQAGRWTCESVVDAPDM